MLTQLLSQRNTPLAPTLSQPPTSAQPRGFIADLQARDTCDAHDNGGSGASRLVTMDSRELTRIIQDGITDGLQQNTQGTIGFTPNTPFSTEVLSYPLLDRFNFPCIKEYGGTIDPINHLNVYTDLMNLQVIPDLVMCKAFTQTLTNAPGIGSPCLSQFYNIILRSCQ